MPETALYPSLLCCAKSILNKIRHLWYSRKAAERLLKRLFRVCSGVKKE